VSGNSQEVIAGRDVLCYTEPFLAANTIVADSAWGTAPGGSWADTGYTKDGLHLQWRMQFIEYTIDQLLDPIARVPQSRDLRLRANLGQIDAPDLVIATGQGTSSSLAAISGTRGHNDFTLTNTLATAYYSTYFDVKGPISGESCRVFGWKGRSVGDMNIDFHLQDIAQVNLEHALVPDDSVSPARICQIRIITPALP
jgi:hypothetical protein